MTSDDPIHPELLPTTRMEALEWATEWSKKEKIFEAPVNARGYTVDNWRPPTPAERIDQLKKLAEWLIEGDHNVDRDEVSRAD